MNDDETPHAEELSASTCWSLLRDVPVGRIALHGVDDEIEIFPINFIVDRGSIVFKTATGTKLSSPTTEAALHSRLTTSM